MSAKWESMYAGNAGFEGGLSLVLLLYGADCGRGRLVPVSLSTATLLPATHDSSPQMLVSNQCARGLLVSFVNVL